MTGVLWAKKWSSKDTPPGYAQPPITSDSCCYTTSSTLSSSWVPNCCWRSWRKHHVKAVRAGLTSMMAAFFGRNMYSAMAAPCTRMKTCVITRIAACSFSVLPAANLQWLAWGFQPDGRRVQVLPHPIFLQPMCRQMDISSDRQDAANAMTSHSMAVESAHQETVHPSRLLHDVFPGRSRSRSRSRCAWRTQCK